jgi:hypothetical protein
MPEFDRKPGTGTLLSKDKRTEKSPDFKGELKLDQDYKAGDVIKISAWQRQSNMGPLISLSIDNWKPDPNFKREGGWQPQEDRRGFSARNPGSNRVLDDEIPF